MRIIAIIIIAGVIVATLFALMPMALFAVSNSGNTESQASDEELVSLTKELPEVQAFLEKYPNTTATVKRGSDIFVQHTVSKSVHEGHPIDQSNVTAVREDSYLYVWVISGSSKSFKVQQISLLCHGGDVIYNQNGTGWTREIHFQINSDIVSYLKEGKEERCFR